MAVLSLLERPFVSMVNRLEIWVRSIATNVANETDWTDSTKGSWYLHPRQHAVELLCLSTGFIAASGYYLQKVCQPSGQLWHLMIHFKPMSRASWTEKLLMVSLLGSLGVTLTHKIIRKNKLFMLQPCHMSAGLLLITMNNPNKSCIITSILFNIYLHTQWGAIAALVFPDLRDHYLIGETFNFFAEHILILVCPVYMIYSGRYLVLPTSKDMALLSFSIYSFFHSPILSICALKSGQNLNYIFSPPPIGFLLRMGRGYRVALYSIALGAMFGTRYGFVEPMMAVIPRKTII
ncbi:TMEM164 family-domain-containing protein [Choanephora cucurbitarum]|nr:TMEM164 family-domain-containing protein [Choanephora cucurbitarum]